MAARRPFSKQSIELDPAKAVDELTQMIRDQVQGVLRKSGVVVGISGGIDSTVVASLCAKALGPDKVLGIMMPEQDSASESRTLAETLAKKLGIKTILEPLTAVLTGYGCYKRRDEAVKRLFPEYDPSTYQVKIGLANNVLEKDTFNYFKATIIGPDGTEQSKRMPVEEYSQVVAASNFKQRARANMVYYHGELLNRAVAGTGNKDEHELGFFVKHGDGAADFKPIAHLFKLQVYQIAKELGVPKAIYERTPTTDTYSAEISQAEFFFGVEFAVLDHVWFGMENGYPAAEIAKALNLSVEQVERIWRDIQQKTRNTAYLRLAALEAPTVNPKQFQVKTEAQPRAKSRK